MSKGSLLHALEPSTETAFVHFSFVILGNRRVQLLFLVSFSCSIRVNYSEHVDIFVQVFSHKFA